MPSVAAALYACLWLLGSSTDRLAFTAGLLGLSLAPIALSYLILALRRLLTQSDWRASEAWH